jgi:hypothetical protein
VAAAALRACEAYSAFAGAMDLASVPSDELCLGGLKHVETPTQGTRSLSLSPGALAHWAGNNLVRLTIMKKHPSSQIVSSMDAVSVGSRERLASVPDWNTDLVLMAKRRDIRRGALPSWPVANRNYVSGERCVVPAIIQDTHVRLEWN